MRVKWNLPDGEPIEIEDDVVEDLVKIVRAVSKHEAEKYAELISLRAEVESLRALTDVLQRTLAKYQKPAEPSPAMGTKPPAP